MSEDSEAMVRSHSVSRNVFVNTISQVVSVAVGLLSSSLLVRSIDISWTISDYAHLKVLMYWSGLLSIIIIMGLTTGIIKSVSESAHKKDQMGSVIGISLLSVTLAFIAVAFVSVFLANQMGFLLSDTPETTVELRALWILVLFALLPSSYFAIAKAVFTGMQRLNRVFVIDLVYNGLRGLILLLLFVTNMITIHQILYLYLGTAILGFIASMVILRLEFQRENISLSLKGWREVSGPLFRVSSIIFALSLLATFGNIIAPLIVDYVGSDTDLARYAIAQRSIETLKAFLYAPFVVLLPNIAGMQARGEVKKFQTRFEEAYRIIIPTLIFAFLATFAFGSDLLGAIYGVRALDITGGFSAAQFFTIMSPMLLIVSMSTLYYNLILAADKMKVLLVFGVLAITLQSLWTIIMQPLFGVLAIAFWWVVFFPMFLSYHLYCKKSLKVHIRNSYLARALLLCGIFGSIMIGTAFLAEYVVNWLSFIPLMTTTTISSIAKLVFVIPLWYIFLGFCIILGLMRNDDLDNLKKFLKQIPPLWWASRPILRIIERISNKIVI